MATIQDIADEVGISKAAVSRILNKKGSFSDETIRKVERAAARLHYTVPASLRKQGSVSEAAEVEHKRIAVILPRSSSPYYGILANLIEQIAYEYQYEVVLYSSMYFQAGEAEFYQKLKERGISGVIMCTLLQEESMQIATEIPTVLLGHSLSGTLTSVRSDNYASGTLAARHLLGKKCRKLLYVSSFPEGLKYDERYRGFKEEVERLKGEEWAYRIASNGLAVGTDPSTNAIGLITKMALEHPDADGFFAESLSVGITLYRTLLNLGYSIPEDAKIVSYANPYILPYCGVDMTVIKENTQGIVSEVVACLIDQIENNEHSAKEIFIPVSLSVGRTT